MGDTTGDGRDRRAVLKGIGAALAGSAVGLAGTVEFARAAEGGDAAGNPPGNRAEAAGSRTAAQEVDTSLPPGAVLFDLDGDGAYDATVERAPESMRDDARPNPIRITSKGRGTVDYAASIVEPDGQPTLGDLDRLSYDYRTGRGGEAAGRAFGVASGDAAFVQSDETVDGNETAERGGSAGGDEPTNGGGTPDSGATTEDGGPLDGLSGEDDGGEDGNGSAEGNEDGGNRGGDEGSNGPGNDGGGNSGGENGGNAVDGDAVAPDETFLVVENDEGRHGMYLTYHDDRADAEWRTHDVLARASGDTAGTSGWFEYTADGEGTFDDVIERFGADARLVRVGVGHGDGVTPTTLDAAYGALVVNDSRYRFPVDVARRSSGAPFRG